MDEIKKIPIVVLNGFLGSGKTTLLRNLIAQSIKNNIYLFSIVNDMSELEVDAEILSDESILDKEDDVLKSISSCVLSSKTGIRKLDKTIRNLLTNKEPDLIIIETSGSSHPMPLIKYFKEQSLVKLTGFFVLVDSLVMAQDFKCGETLIPKMQQNMIEGVRDIENLLVEQILFCSHLILTKGDRVKEQKLTEIATHIKKINPFSSSYSVVFGKMKIESLFEIDEYNYSNVEQLFQELEHILDSEQQLNKPYDLVSSVIKDDRPFHPQRFWDVCQKYLDKRIYRSKGFFWLASRNKHSLLWNQAGGGISLELIGIWRSAVAEDKNHGLLETEIQSLKEKLKEEPGRFGDRRCDLTVIGNKEQIDKFTVKLKSCFLTDDEIKLYKHGHIFKDPWPKNIVKIRNE